MRIIAPGQTLSGKYGEYFSAIPSLSQNDTSQYYEWALNSPSESTLLNNYGLEFNRFTGEISGNPKLILQSPVYKMVDGVLTEIGRGLKLVMTAGINSNLDPYSYEDVIIFIDYGAPDLEGQYLVRYSNEAFARRELKFGYDYSPIVQGVETPHSKIVYSNTNRPVTALTLTGLPPGVSRVENNSISYIDLKGNPTQAGDYILRLDATGPGGTDTAEIPLKIRFGNPTPKFGQSFSGIAGVAFSAQLEVSDPVNAPFGVYKSHYTDLAGPSFNNNESPDFNGSGDWWDVSTLPAGLSVDSTGQITGTPVFSGNFVVNARIRYSNNWELSNNLGEQPVSETVSFTLSIAGSTDGTPQLYTIPSGLKGTDTVSMTPAWNAAGAAWSATGLPAGVSILSSTGEITGTILSKGTFSVTVSVVYDGITYSESFVLEVAPGAPAIKPDQTISLIYGEGKTAHLRNLLEDPSKTYSDWSSFTLSGLPTWAVFDPSGSYTGTDGIINYPSPPPERGTWIADITVTGSGGSTTGTFTFEVGFGPPIITPGQSVTGKLGEPVYSLLTLEDVANRPKGDSWTDFRVSAQSALPAGLAVDMLWAQDGFPLPADKFLIYGTPTAAGQSTVLIAPLNPPEFDNPGANNDVSYETVTFDIAYGAPQITLPFSLPTGKVGDAYSSTAPALTDAANRPVTTWSATGLPAWASFDETTGAITGTPQDTGSHTVAITATGPGGTDSVSASLVVAIGSPIITSGQSFTGKVGEAFTAQVALEDALDRPADTWSATSLPSGLTLDTSTGEITGTPTSYGAISATITASNAAGSDTKNVDFTITAGTPIIPPSQSFSTKVGAAFSATPTLTDATNRPVTSWSAAGLPGWLSLDTTTGKLTGTPQDAETLTFSLTATGPGGSDTESAEVVVALGAPIIDPATFTGKVGEAFTGGFTLSDAADRPATEWSASNLPAGLSIDAATGAISGTPTTRVDTVAVIVATGPGGTGVPLSVPFSVTAGAPIITAGQFFAAVEGQGFSTTPALTDAANRPATSWSASGLPDWATIDGATGAISGTPTSTSPASLTLTATGPGGTSEPQTYIITVTTSSTGGGGDPEEPAIPMISLVSGQTFTATLGQAFSATPSLLTGTAATWHASGLPDWATIDQTTGQITGNPTYTGTATVLITVQEASGVSAADYISITAVSWNTLELYIDPRARKFLSKANSKYPLSKIAMKRFDRMPFQLAFVDGSTAFSVPSSYEVTVGLKKNYGDTTYLAFATNTNGVLELNTDAIEAVFADEPDIVPALFEVRWQDSSSAFRTATIPAEIQNSVIKGDIADPGMTTVGGSFVASAMEKYLAARQKILTGETAETTTLTLSEPLAGEAIFHRPLANNLPDRRGWITEVSAVSLEGDGGTEALVAEADFVFYPDRQCFYFLNPETTGDIEILGTASRNFINFGVTIQKSVAAASSTSTLIDTTSSDFEITGVSITSEDMGGESPDGFYFDRATATLFLKTNFSCSSAVVVFKNALGEEFEETFAGLTDASTLSVPKSLSAASVVKVTMSGTVIGGESVGDFTPFAVLEKTDAGDDTLHLGWNWPSGYTNGDFTVSASKGTDTFVFTFGYWPGNAFELPRFLDNVHALKIGGSDALVVFDSTEQKVDFCQAKTGTLHYTATHKAYEGLANGGETLQVVAEIPGVFATTAGTGHHISTLRTLNPSQDWYNWWYAEEGIYFVQIVDDKNVVIYQDDSNGAFAKSRPGYTAEELKPLTLKLPFAALWSLSPRDDTSLFQEAFTPNFATATFSSATYPELDDTQRYAAESMGAGKTITLSTNKTAPVRGVQGVDFTGPKPTYYAGGTVPYFVLATYKWFVVKCVDTNTNPLLTANKNYLLCVNNTNFDNRAIMVNITNEGYNVAADLYEIKEGN